MRAVFIGDRPWGDISGAWSNGMGTVLRPNPVAPPIPGIEPHAEIRPPPKLVELVRAWSAD